jgi:hypothetical protein
MGTPWHPLLSTTRGEAAELAEIALALQPRLCRAGIGVLNERYKTVSQVERELEEERDALRSNLPAIAACADWLRLQRWLNTFTGQTSFSRKFDVEIWFQVRGGPTLAVSNGALIAAALGLGVEAKVLGDGPNMVFKLAEGPTSIASWERARITTTRAAISLDR